MTQTELDYQTLFDKNAYLSEYEKYFGHKLTTKLNTGILKVKGPSPMVKKEYASLPQKYQPSTVIEYRESLETVSKEDSPQVIGSQRFSNRANLSIKEIEQWTKRRPSNNEEKNH